MSATPAPANPSSEPRILSTFRAVEFWWLKIPEELRYLFLCLTAWGSSTDVRTRRQRIATGFPLALIAIAITISFLNPHAKAAPEAKHGLIGQYYVSQLPGDSPTEHRLYFTQIWTNRDDFQLPHALTDPAVTRVMRKLRLARAEGLLPLPRPDIARRGRPPTTRIRRAGERASSLRIISRPPSGGATSTCPRPGPTILRRFPAGPQRCI